VEFSDWITEKFVEWRGGRVGQSASVAEFAKLFGASQPLVSGWMKAGGKVPRAKKYINALAAVYGDEAYEVLGLSKRGGEALSIDQLSEDERAGLEAFLR